MIFTLPNCRVHLNRQHAFGFPAAAPEKFGGVPNFCSQSQTFSYMRKCRCSKGELT